MLKVFTMQTIFPSSFHKSVKQRMNGKRFRFVLGVKLAADEIRVDVSWQLDHFDKFSVGRNSADDKAFFFKHCPIFRVKFVTMPMTFADLYRAVVDLACE